MSVDARTAQRRRAIARARRRGQIRRRRATALAVIGLFIVGIVILATAGGGASGSHAQARSSRRGGPVASPAAQRAALDRFAAVGRPIYCGGRTRRMAALTFDDGPGPYTSMALRKLRAAHAPATFFLVGKEIAEHHDLPSLEHAQGALGDHTWTHPYLPGLDPAASQGEIARTQQLVAAVGGAPVRLFRPPYGARTRAVDSTAAGLGMAEILWDVDTRDSEGADYAGIAANVRREVRPGSIVLMHENRGQTIRALDHVLQTLRHKRLTPVTVPELLAADPPSRAQVAAGPRGCGRSAGTAAEGRSAS
jgi:peptidoglycan/xylan/chitin deacetylase (PgdA/CDA1 family)